MKNYSVNPSEYIGNAVFSIKSNYTELQNKTKILYFDYLKKGKSVEQFEKKVSKLWDNIDHKFMDKQIAKLQEILHSVNVKAAIDIGRVEGIDYYKVESQEWIINDEFFKLIPESDFNKIEKKFKERVVKSYTKANKVLSNKDEMYKEVYLEKKLETYDETNNQIVAYYNKDGGIQRYTQLSSYLSMLHNVDLTRSGWNQTMVDADKLNANYFIIPYHPFSCEYCQMYQNRPLSRLEVEQVLGLEAEEQIGDILHPNCKCTLSILWDSSQIQRDDYSILEKEEQYKIRQKVNGLSLEANKTMVDIQLAKKMGNEGLADKLNSKLAKIYKKEQELINKLPTTELKKQVEAINR